ncbi:Hypothetical predicted protein [Olea europaea subsp. europaea]|uniref:Uncharacterized protein n=1 Tax=Olea europaea subsp. europaea TaxID=158383 RepID=A0A8S0RI35_OLEEU|nr:Hypothetical predicted protein [Olea europaea subsp. europaea]
MLKELETRVRRKENGRSAVPTKDSWSIVSRMRKEGSQDGVYSLRIWDETSVQKVYLGDSTAEETSHHKAQAKTGENGRIFLKQLVYQPSFKAHIDMAKIIHERKLMKV